MKMSAFTRPSVTMKRNSPSGDTAEIRFREVRRPVFGFGTTDVSPFTP